MKRMSLLSLGLALTLPLLSASRPAAAADVKVLAQAVGEKDPLTVSWVDSADGKVGIDDKVSAQIHDLFAGAQYVFTDSGQLLLGHVHGADLEPILPAAIQIHNDKDTFFIVHLRSQDSKTFLDGDVVRYSDDPTKGFADLNLLLINSSGASASTHIEQNLTFPAQSPGSSPSASRG